MNKPYLPPMSRTWWWERPGYRLFMLRELSSVFVGLYAAEVICFLARMPDAGVDREQYVRTFFESSASPGWVLFHVVALGFVLLHSITWFNLTPKVLVVHIGEERFPDGVVAGAHYALWVAVSLLIWWIVI